MDEGHEYTHISTATTTNIGLGTNRITLKGITINTTAAGAITIKDGTATVAVFKASIAEGQYLFGRDGIAIGNGCTIVTAGASDVTAIWTNL